MKGQIAVIFALIAFSYGIPQAEEAETIPEEATTLTPEPSAPSAKRRQFIAPPPVYAPVPAVPVVPVAPVVGQCPGGPSLPIECDAKKPWPSCPPQSYCYAVGTVDIGPYFCCPVWSTYGAAWRPATPFYNYVPPPPANWPEHLRAAASWPTAALSMPAFAPRSLKKKTEQKFNDDNIPTEDQQKIDESMSKWLDRQSKKL